VLCLTHRVCRAFATHLSATVVMCAAFDTHWFDKRQFTYLYRKTSWVQSCRIPSFRRWVTWIGFGRGRSHYYLTHEAWEWYAFCIRCVIMGVFNSVLYSRFCLWISIGFYSKIHRTTLCLDEEEWVKFHVHTTNMLLTCGICTKTLPALYLHDDSDCVSFSYRFRVRSFFWGAWERGG